jgi:hypothetical protein
MVDVTYKSWGERLIDSIKGVVIGIVLFIVSFPLLFWNEGRAVDTARALDEGSKNVIAVPSADKVDPANEGKLVHLTAEATTTENLEDKEFLISEKAIYLGRNVEMYQWKEDKHTKSEKQLGGGEKEITEYTYNRVWSKDVIPSGGFAESGHSNPSTKPFDDGKWQAKKVTLGAFDLSLGLVSTLINKGKNRRAVETADLARLPTELKDELKVNNGQFYKGKEPGSPQIGDTRIEFEVVKPQTVSIVAKQTGSTFEPYKTSSAKHTIELLDIGTKSAEAMFEEAVAENNMLTWILRLVGFILMAVGIFLVINPLVTVADVVPFIGNLLGAGAALFALLLSLPLTLATISVGWVFYRPLIGVPLLLGAIALLVGGIWLLRRRSPAALDQRRG